MNRLREAVLDHQRANGLTNRQIAESAGVRDEAISRFLSGARDATPSLVAGLTRMIPNAAELYAADARDRALRDVRDETTRGAPVPA